MEVARRAVWTEDPREWGYALLDYGATELRDRAINRRSRHYARQPAFEGSFRSFRTQALRYVLAQEGTSMSRAELEGLSHRSDWQQGIIRTPLRMFWMPSSMTDSSRFRPTTGSSYDRVVMRFPYR